MNDNEYDRIMRREYEESIWEEFQETFVGYDEDNLPVYQCDLEYGAMNNNDISEDDPIIGYDDNNRPITRNAKGKITMHDDTGDAIELAIEEHKGTLYLVLDIWNDTGDAYDISLGSAELTREQWAQLVDYGNRLWSEDQDAKD